MANPFISATEDATGNSYRPGNTLHVLQNGDEIFPAMLEAIRSAEKTIEFSTYVYWRSHIANDFADALSERARAGVRVRLLVDAVGAAVMSARTVWQLERSGVTVGWFRPVRWPYLQKFNNRSHRKILLVDGQVGFTGGVGIADEWTGAGQDSGHWRETHCRITGPACDDIHASFADSWFECTREHLSKHQSTAPKDGRIAVQVTSSTAGPRPTSMERLVLASISTARERLWITSAYFVPSEAIITELIRATGKGVDVRVLTNGPLTNHKITRQAGRATYAQLLAGGVKLYEYQGGMHHAKVITADSSWATIGSSNLDDRSLVLNDELNASFTDGHLITALDRQFLEDLNHADHIRPDGWARRSRLGRLAEAGSSLFARQL